MVASHAGTKITHNSGAIRNTLTVLNTELRRRLRHARHAGQPSAKAQYMTVIHMTKP
jgi:hypothetical protein